VAYAVQIEALEKRVTTLQTAAAFRLAMGSEEDMPDPDLYRASFDQWLESPPEAPDPNESDEDRNLKQALGLT
jgi:hypothetical protein